MRETRMNTAFLYHSILHRYSPYQTTRRFDTEEVVGSSPGLRQQLPQARAHRRCCRVRHVGSRPGNRLDAVGVAEGRVVHVANQPARLWGKLWGPSMGNEGYWWHHSPPETFWNSINYELHNRPWHTVVRHGKSLPNHFGSRGSGVRIPPPRPCKLLIIKYVPVISATHLLFTATVV
jgi:hypothetical protein